MKIVAALTDPARAQEAEELGADMIELRFDLIEGTPADLVQQCRDRCTLPVIGTLRSAQEGGRFFGDAGAWEEKIRPAVSLVEYVDVEQQFMKNAAFVRETGTKVIASHHSPAMLPLSELFMLERELRAYGDIVKIVVTPSETDDIIDLIAFTNAIRQPICCSVTGPAFRFARAVLPLFGSALVYCHMGESTAEGQYSVAEFAQLRNLLTGTE